MIDLVAGFTIALRIVSRWSVYRICVNRPVIKRGSDRISLSMASYFPIDGNVYQSSASSWPSRGVMNLAM